MELQIGKKLRKLSKHKSKKISAAASLVVEAWKQAVATEASLASPSGQKSLGNSQQFDMNNGGSQTAKESVDKSSGTVTDSNGQNSNGKVLKTEPSLAKSKEEKLDLGKLPKTGDVTRDKFRELIALGLSMVGNEIADELKCQATSSKVFQVAVDVEKELWSFCGGDKKDKVIIHSDMEFLLNCLNGACILKVSFSLLWFVSQEYKSKYRSLSFNMKDLKNPDLRRRVLFGEVMPMELMTMSADDMASDQLKRQKSEIEKKMLFETTRGITMTASTDQFKCGKCGQRKTTYYQMQTRSADEPMTTYVTCLNCNNRWKFC